MAGNRKLPFGYRMERGEITENPVEAEAVREIFHRYLAGASYAALVPPMTGTSPGTRTWWLGFWRTPSIPAAAVSPL